jgi:hypothetical protein
MKAIVISLESSTEEILMTEPEYLAAQAAAIEDMQRFDADLNVKLLEKEDRDVYMELTALHYMAQQQYG